MNSEVLSAMKISAQGMKIQGERLKISAENMANSQTTSSIPGGDPYARKTISFKNVMDKELGARIPEVKDVKQDTADFPIEFDPDHPAANEEGYVKKPNVNPLVEMMNAKEAQRTYEANLGLIDQSRTMMMRTIDLLRR